MVIRTYEGQIEKGIVRLKDAPILLDGMKVYVVIPEIEGTAFDPTPAQIVADMREALAEYEAGHAIEIQGVDDLMRLLDDPEMV